MDPVQYNVDVAPSGEGCVECDADGGWWVHLRRCTACGHVGCCDSSLGQHATAHFEATGHRYMQSFEPGEDWVWDFIDGEGVEGLPALAEPSSHPESQPAPGPKGRVPLNWRALLEAGSS